MDIAVSLLGNGFSPTATYQTLRDKFEPDVTDSELEGVVHWAQSQNPTPSGHGERTNGNGYHPQQRWTPAPAKPVVPKKPPLEIADWWLAGLRVEHHDFVNTSPIAIPESRRDAAALFFDTLYRGSDCLNIVCAHLLDGEKARPCGGGKVLTVDDWQDWLGEKGVPQSAAGAWIRFNPCKPEGSGKEGAVTDADIVSHRFVLLESDVLPLDVQLALFSKLKLPIACVIHSGGASAHAWVKVQAETIEQYRAIAFRLLTVLEPFGIDPANKNASRLSRLPGAIRTIGAKNGGEQSLLWLKSAVQPLTESSLAAFEETLKIPIAEERPFHKIILHAQDRYEELVANRGRLGVPTGIHRFDRDTGGLKGGQMTVIAAETNGGKSTVAINFANGALQQGHGVALFTLEMDRDEICDLLVSMNCRVNRNYFNTGYFSEDDLTRIAQQSRRLSNLPLWVDDSPSLTMDQIRARVVQLKAENKIGLVIIDYVQIVAPPDSRSPREQQVAEIARAIRILCKETKLPFVVLSQLNDEGKLRESRVVAHEAHNVIMLEPEDASPPRKMLMKVVKGRRIMKKDYELQYEPEFCIVSSQRHGDDPEYQSNEPRNQHNNE